MSKLKYAEDGVYQEVKGTLDIADGNISEAINYSRLLVLDDFPQVDYVRNQLTPDLEKVREELDNIKQDIIKMDANISELTDTINNSAKVIDIITPEQRKRMIL